MNQNSYDGPDPALPQHGDDYPGVDLVTGEVIEEWTSADLAPPEFSPGSLMRYAREKTELDALRLRFTERANALVAADAAASALARRIEERLVEVSAMEAAFEAAFTPAQRRAQVEPISLDLGFLRVTWPKPADNWTMRDKLSDIDKRDPALSKRLGIVNKPKKPAPPLVLIRAEKLGMGPR